MITFKQMLEKKLTPAELKKREEVAKAIERDNPDMPMDKKMAIATATAKKVAEDVDQLDELSTGTLTSYMSKASDARAHRKLSTKKVDNRYAGVKKASDEIEKRHQETLAKMAQANEETQPQGEPMSSMDKYLAAIDGNASFTTRVDEATHPKTAKEKELAKLAPPHDKITHADVMVGRGVKKEEMSSKEKMKRGLYNKEEVEAEEVEEAVGTAAKYADKKGFMGDKYSSHDRMMDMKNFDKVRSDRAKKRDDEHEKQDPKMAKAGYAKHMVDTDKAEKKAAARGIKANLDWRNRNGIAKGKLPESVEESWEDKENPTGIKIYHKDAKTGKEHGSILFTAKSAHDHEQDLKKAGHKVTGRSLMYGNKEGSRKSVNEEFEQIDESTPTRQQVKQAIGIARDKRYAGGNMTGAAKAMDKINKGLAQHPAVEKELKKQNEETVEEAKATPCGRCGTTHVPPSQGGTCPALKEAMISYSDFQSKIAAHKKAGNKVQDDKYSDKKATYTTVDKDGMGRKVTHTPSGTKMETLGKMGGKDE